MGWIVRKWKLCLVKVRVTGEDIQAARSVKYINVKRMTNFWQFLQLGKGMIKRKNYRKVKYKECKKETGEGVGVQVRGIC